MDGLEPNMAMNVFASFMRNASRMPIVSHPPWRNPDAEGVVRKIDISTLLAKFSFNTQASGS